MIGRFEHNPASKRDGAEPSRPRRFDTQSLPFGDKAQVPVEA
jgi:hypothetical protein